MTTIIECSLLDFNVEKGEWNGVSKVVECRKALSPSGLPFLDYSINPYLGCEHGCVYCYAPRMMHRDPSSWRVVGVKVNIVERLVKELPGITGRIGFGTVTDPYQYAEKRFLLTRRCLDVISKKDVRVTILTKSDLVVRDALLLKDMDADVHVGITTIDDRMSKMTEPGAPPPSKRLDAVRTLVSEGIDVKINVAPAMSTLSGMESELADAIGETGIHKVYIDGLNLRYADTKKLDRMEISPSDSVVSNLSKELSRRGIEPVLFKQFIDDYTARNGF